MTKPSILLVTHFYPTHRGGVEIGAGKIAKLLSEKGFRIVWAASDSDPIPDSLANVEFMPMKADNRIEQRLGIPFPLWDRGSLKRLSLKAKEVDIVHIHEALYVGNRAAVRAAKEAGKPYLVTQHIGFIPYKNPVLRLILTVANRWIAMPVLRGAKCVTFVSETTQRYFQSLGLSSEQCELIPMGVDTDIYTPLPVGNREVYGFAKDRPLCVFVGRFVEKKGLPILRKIAEAYPNVQWALAGHGTLDPTQWGLPNVKVFSNLSGSTLAPLYRASDLFVMPSIGEGYPAVVQEAMACGTPVLISSETAEGYLPARRMLHHHPFADLEGWPSTTMKLLSELESLQASSPALVDFARSHWSMETCVNRFEALVLRLTAGKNA